MTDARPVAATVAVKILSDAEVAKLSPQEMAEYFAPCIDALDLDKPLEYFDRGDVVLSFSRPEGTVYFVGGAGDAIKIGFTIRAVDDRLKEYQAGSPVALKVLAVSAGQQALESSYHRRFAAHRLHGEWFEPHPDILAEIERLNRKAEQ